LVHGDSTRFTQALLNLAGNSVKFTDHGSIVIRVRQQETQNKQILVRVEVEDSGIGIPSEDLARLFAPFEQVDASISRRHGGTGLGLVITRRLAKMMGGEAGGESLPGKGSTFWFTVLLKPGAPSNKTLKLSQINMSAGEELKRNFTGTRLLVVEDEPINQEVATILLNEVGMDVTVANNGLEALTLATNQQFSLVLMDMQMPKMDGLEATRRIRKLPGWEVVPVVAMTANAFAEDRTHCLEAGMNDFITKPFDPEKFYSLLLSWLSNSKV
jgi:CheY-like chemotaxis protein